MSETQSVRESTSTSLLVEAPLRRGTNGRYAVPIVGAGVAVAAWEIIVRLLDVPPYLLPAPSAVLEAMTSNFAQLMNALGATALSATIGFVISFLVAVILAALISESKIINQLVYPWLVIAHAIPKAAIAPLFLVWLGFGLASKVMFVVTFCVFPLVVNTVSGLSQANPDQVQLVRAMGASRFAVFRMIRVPTSLPSVFAGIKISATLAPVGAVIGEFVASNDGIGHLLIGAIGNLDTAVAFAAIVLVSAFGVAIWYAVEIAERVSIPWHVSQRTK